MSRRGTLRDNDCRVIACQSNDRTDSAMHDTSMIEQTESWRGSNAGTKTFLCNNVTCVCIVIGKTTYDIAKKSTSCLNNGVTIRLSWLNNVVERTMLFIFFFNNAVHYCFNIFVQRFVRFRQNISLGMDTSGYHAHFVFAKNTYSCLAKQIFTD